jgi:uncharacterized protein (DUF1501 family)
MNMTKNLSRRAFLNAASVSTLACGAAGSMALNLALCGKAAAQTTTPYKALVMIWLGGGNDSFNTLLATDPSSWTEYQRWRNTGARPIALPAAGAAGGVLPIVPYTLQAGRSFALHPNLAGARGLFDAGKLAIISNVGPITGPVDPSNYTTGVLPFLPPALYSHNDQTSVWQSQSPEGASSGWGGRMGDLLLSGNGANAVFTTIAADGGSTWLSGANVIQYRASRDGGVQIGLLQPSANAQEQALAAIAKRIIERGSSHILETEVAAISRRSISAEQTIRASLLPRGTAAGAVPDSLALVNPAGITEDNPLAVQLQTVARIIGARTTLGINKQVFMVSLNEFDHHTDQFADHNYRMRQLDQALSYFDSILSNLNGVDMRSQVTAFTAAEFGRTFSTNGSGTDHGFGAHHFVYGGAVRGKDIYGAVPPSGVGHGRDFGGKGAILPLNSVDQFGATLGKWFGMSDAQLLNIFPNLSRYNPSARNLGFMI